LGVSDILVLRRRLHGRGALVGGRVIAIATVGVLPAFAPLDPKDPNDPHFPAYLASIWEPPGRDRLTKLRAEAERQGSVHPCLWFKLSDWETSLGMTNEAARDGKRATIPRERCR
jgi:hypothetical protein